MSTASIRLNGDLEGRDRAVGWRRGEGRLTGIGLFYAAFVAGWAVMQAELLAARTLAPFFGYSIYQWGALIGVVMSAMALGSSLGGLVGDRPSAETLLTRILLAATTLFAVTPSLASTALPVAADLGPYWGAMAASVVLLGGQSVLLGMVTPIVISLAGTGGRARNAGRVFALSTVGSIAGTFATAFLVIPRLGTTFGYYGCVLITASAVVILACSRRRPRRPLALVIVCVVATFPVHAGRPANAVLIEETVHNLIEVVDSGDRRLLYLNSLRWPQTVIKKSELLTGLYYDAVLIGPYLGGAAEALVLGVGGGTSIRQLHETFPTLQITGVELDATVLTVAKQYFDLPESSRISLVNADARAFIQESRETYDLIFVDTYVAGHVPFYLTTREFFETLRHRLSDSGVMMMNVVAPGDSVRLLGPLGRTIREVFDSVFLIGHGNVIVIATLQERRLEEMRDLFTGSPHSQRVASVLARYGRSLRPAPDDLTWPIFTDDKNDVELRTYQAAGMARRDNRSVRSGPRRP